MLKKLMVIVVALFLGGIAAGAADLVLLELYFNAKCSITPEGTLPNGVFRTAPKKNSKGGTAFPYYINIDKAKSAELKLKIKGNGKLNFALYAFRKVEGQKNQTIAVTCKKFEFGDAENSWVPRVINRWKRVMTRDVHDGDIITVRLEFEKTEE